jgi:hypothetical protein
MGLQAAIDAATFRSAHLPQLVLPAPGPAGHGLSAPLLTGEAPPPGPARAAAPILWLMEACRQLRNGLAARPGSPEVPAVMRRLDLLAAYGINVGRSDTFQRRELLAAYLSAGVAAARLYQQARREPNWRPS